MRGKRAQKQDNSTSENPMEAPQHERGNMGERGDNEATVPSALHIR